MWLILRCAINRMLMWNQRVYSNRRHLIRNGLRLNNWHVENQIRLSVISGVYRSRLIMLWWKQKWNFVIKCEKLCSMRDYCMIWFTGVCEERADTSPRTNRSLAHTHTHIYYIRTHVLSTAERTENRILTTSRFIETARSSMAIMRQPKWWCEHYDCAPRLNIRYIIINFILYNHNQNNHKSAISS